jgi:RNA polymerase sigma-54 factor
MRTAISQEYSGNIDDMGYIRRSVADMVNDIAFTKTFTDEKWWKTFYRSFMN